MLTASIVVYHHSLQEIQKVVGCVLTSPVDKLYIIDNSSDNRLSELAKISDRIIYIHTGKNLGFGRGHNIAIREIINCRGKYHIVINPDIYFAEGVIEELTDYMDHHKNVGLIMPKVLYPDGEVQYLCKLLPNPWNLMIRRLIPEKWVNRKSYRYELRFADYNRIMSVPSLSGCFMFLRVDILKQVEGFDERYFMYLEDLDLCRRIGRIAETIYYPLVHIYHVYEKGSYKNRKLLGYHVQSAIKYFNRWGWLFDKERRRVNQTLLLKLDYKNRLMERKLLK